MPDSSVLTDMTVLLPGDNVGIDAFDDVAAGTDAATASEAALPAPLSACASDVAS